MSDEQIREIKHNLCVNCGERYCCHGMRSCVDVMEYIKKREEKKND